MNNPEVVPLKDADWKDKEEGSTYTTIFIRVKNDNVQVKMEFWPQLDPKNPTFDQVAGSVAIAAISEFIRTGEPPNIPPPDAKN